MKCRRFHRIDQRFFFELVLVLKNVKDSVKILPEVALVLTTGSLLLHLLPSWNFWEKFHQKSLSCQNMRAEWSKQARCCRRFADVFFSWQGVESASLYGLICRCLCRGVPDCDVDLQMFIRGTVPGYAWFICRCLFVARCRRMPGLFADVYSWHDAGKYLVYLQMFICGTVPGNAWFICRCLN